MANFRQLRYFVAVAQEMHFGRAADILHVAQPSLSQNIRQLEEDLGILLFERTSRSVKLTEAGKLFYEEAIRAVEQMEVACRVARRAARGELGRLSIGFGISTMMGELHVLIRHFHEQFASVELSLREMAVDEMAEQLLSGELDLICSDSAVDDSRLESVPILTSSGVLAMHRTHPLAGRHSLKLVDLKDDDFIFPAKSPAHRLHDQMLGHCHQAGFTPKISHIANSVPGAVSLVCAKLGVAMVNDLPGYRPPEVVFKRITDVRLDLRVRLSWRAGRLTPMAANFVRLVDTAASYGDSSSDPQSCHRVMNSTTPMPSLMAGDI